MAREPSICVITHPLAAAGENATRTLLDVLAAITSVCLVTADLDDDSAIRDRHEVVDLTHAGAGDTIAVAAARFLLNQCRMCRTIVRRDEEVILFFGATAYVVPVLFARLIGRTVVIEPRGDVPLTLYLHWKTRVPEPIARLLAGIVRALERIDFRIADAIITYTPSMAATLDLEPFEHKLYTNGARYVDTDRFSIQISYDERERRVGFLGRLDEEKGIRQLAEAARALPSDVAFRFIGDGELRPWLERTLAAEIEAGRVEVIGWVDHDDVPAELNRLALLVMPSQPTEGLPTTVLESLACGTPVYATPVSGVPDVVRPGETGFLMESRNPAAISSDIERILSRDDLERISANGRALIEREYSFDAAVDRYRDILAGLT